MTTTTLEVATTTTVTLRLMTTPEFAAMIADEGDRILMAALKVSLDLGNAGASWARLELAD